jgi:hypothetical protein
LAAAAADSTKKRAKDEIDEIFGKSKKKAPAAAANAEEGGEAAEAAAADPGELQLLAKQVEEARQKVRAGSSFCVCLGFKKYWVPRLSSVRQG